MSERSGRYPLIVKVLVFMFDLINMSFISTDLWVIIVKTHTDRYPIEQSRIVKKVIENVLLKIVCTIQTWVGSQLHLFVQTNLAYYLKKTYPLRNNLLYLTLHWLIFSIHNNESVVNKYSSDYKIQILILIQIGRTPLCDSLVSLLSLFLWRRYIMQFFLWTIVSAYTSTK